jgi:AcrR family transcriptional regulator
MVQTTPAPAPPVEASRADLTRRRILEAAARVFRRQGLQATGMREIAAELGMHAGNLYYYFRDKGELLAFCQEATLERLLALAARVEAADEAADTKLRALVAGHVVELNEAIPGSLAHLEIEAIDEERRPSILAKRDDYEETWRRVIDEGVATGVFRAVDSATAARALLGAVNWTVKWFRADGEKTPREIGDAMADLLVHGLVAASVASAASPSSASRSAASRGDARPVRRASRPAARERHPVPRRGAEAARPPRSRGGAPSGERRKR